jgi:dolichyl-phosphate-mannose-protein mannosyltransferase
MKWYGRLFRYPEIWLLSLFSILTRTWHLGYPSAIVFDEVYFRSFASDYLSGQYFFDIHPPLIKLLFAGVGSMLSLAPDQVASTSDATIALRAIPALSGAALIPLIYVIIRQLGLGRRIATFGALLILFDNALLVESRFVLMDSILLLSGFASFSIYLALRRKEGRERVKWLILLGISLGILVSTKWSGLAFFGLIGLWWVVDVSRSMKFDVRAIIYELLTVSTIVICVYISSFALHFSLLTKTGEGDVYMSEKFQATLVGNPRYNENDRLPFLDKFIELNQQMYSSQSSLNNTTHPYSSRWYTWPLMLRPVYYWQGEPKSNGTQEHIYLIGNPVVWLIGLISLIIALFVRIFRNSWLKSKKELLTMLLIGYFINFVPFIFIQRPMFLYHYFFAFILSILIACVMLWLLMAWLKKSHSKKVANTVYVGTSFIVIMSFVFFLPLSYGWPLSLYELDWRVWLPSWR